MKAYSIDLREKIVKAYLQGDTFIRKVAQRFGVAKSFVQKLLFMNKSQDHVKLTLKRVAIKGKRQEINPCRQILSLKEPSLTFD